MVEAKIFSSYSGTGIAVLTSANRIFLVNNMVEPKVRQISEIPSERHKFYPVYIYFVAVDKSVPFYRFPFFPEYGGSIDCWCLVHCDRETRVILSNRDGIFAIHQSYQNATHIPFVKYSRFIQKKRQRFQGLSCIYF